MEDGTKKFSQDATRKKKKKDRKYGKLDEILKRDLEVPMTKT